MMTDDERRKVFWLLKKYSSYTAWKALGDAYATFVDAWMVAMQKADDADVDAFNQNATKSILDGRIAFEKGLQRLRSGDRSVWRDNARGWLSKACDQVVFVSQITNEKEFVLDWMKNKDEILRARVRLDAAFNRLGSVNERPASMAAALGAQNAFAPAWSPFNFPLSVWDVPVPSETTVDTGDEVPVDGIYEPEWGSVLQAAPTTLLTKLKTVLYSPPESLAQSKTLERREHIGCMNYLLAGSLAPSYRDDELEHPHTVTWRLIWKDERYRDGVIPPEEAQYLADSAESIPLRLRCEANQPCPREGYWHTPAKTDSRRHFQVGEVMPDLHTDYGSTIWVWDEKQG